MPKPLTACPFDDFGAPSATWLYSLSAAQQAAYPEFRDEIQGRYDIEDGAAGNSDQNAGFAGDVPASLHLPNLLAVGAVNQASEETSFTSFGATVAVHANGYEVKSVVPGGATMKLSGTSMASPNVVNLAAKLFALDPTLTPQRAIGLIKAGATPSPDGRLHLIDGKRSVELLQNAQSRRGDSGHRW